MRLLDLTLPKLAENLALDEALLLDAEADGAEVLRFWEWSSSAVIIGAGGRWAVEADGEACKRDAVPVLRRASGGGAVLLGRGCFLFSLVLAYEREPVLADLHGSYRWILKTIAAALATCAPGIVPAGISDLAIDGRKCSGNAQQRKRTHLLHHGTLLCSFDVSQIPRYLTHPPREPDYRQHRSHLDFVTNLDMSMATAKQCLCNAWDVVEPMNDWPRDLVRTLCAEKYNCKNWHQRR